MLKAFHTTKYHPYKIITGARGVKFWLQHTIFWSSSVCTTDAFLRWGHFLYAQLRSSTKLLLVGWEFTEFTHNPQKVNVWTDIVDKNDLGSFFFNETLNSDPYLYFLHFDLIPSLAVLKVQMSIWYQQDGPLPHYALSSREYLNEIF